MALKFYYNGIREDNGRLQRCSYSDGELLHYPKGTITIYGKGYHAFSVGVCEAFAVENNSDMVTDYFENDKIRVTPDHPLYEQVKNAIRKGAKENA